MEERKPMKVYISGKITNNPNYKKQFEEAEKRLKKAGNIVMNPAILPEGFEWDEYMKICIAMLDPCEAIYLLENWTSSKGAITEKSYALKKNKIIMHEDELTEHVCDECNQVFFLNEPLNQYEGNKRFGEHKILVCPG
jgi:hypothetical protein